MDLPQRRQNFDENSRWSSKISNKVLYRSAFLRVIKKFMTTGQIAHKKSPGAPHYASSKENVKRVRSMVKNGSTASLSATATLLDLTE